MEAPEKPADEEERLAALRALELLDTPSEERFDRITRTAARLFDVPMSMVTLVDEDRQFFKSCFGREGRETSRDISFCGHAILRPGPFIIVDAQVERRFADNPQVTGPPYVRFYAGIPIHSTSGHAIGSFCIVDTEPREPTDEDLDGLVDLAAWAETEIHQVEFSRALTGCWGGMIPPHWTTWWCAGERSSTGRAAASSTPTACSSRRVSSTCTPTTTVRRRGTSS